MRQVCIFIVLTLCWSPHVAAHYASYPCMADEALIEVQGASGYICSPRCQDSTYECPADKSGGATALQQCMYQDVSMNRYCGLLCQMNSQCPSGAVCNNLVKEEIGICMFTASFTDWVSRSGDIKKLAVGFPERSPSSGSVLSFQVAKTFASLQNLKVKLNIDDGDADLLYLKEFLGSISVPGGTRGRTSALTRSGANDKLFDTQVWQHDIDGLSRYLGQGLPGIQRELGDIVWTVEHMDRRGAASTFLRGFIFYAVIYLLIGSAIKYQMMGARGLDMIPHIGFWVEYPGLVVDGFLYSKDLARGVFGYAPTMDLSSPVQASVRSTGIRGGTGSFESMSL